MEWQSVMATAGAIVTSVGGSGIIICAVANFLSSRIADRMQKKYESILNEQNEKYKAILENKTRISQKRFDMEFEVYKDLSRRFAQLIKEVSILIPTGIVQVPFDPSEKAEYDHRHIMSTKAAYVDAQDSLNSNAIFIPDAICDAFYNLLHKCGRQISAMEMLYSASNLSRERELSRDDYKMTDEIQEDYKKLKRQVRDYIKSLDVLEDKN